MTASQAEFIDVGRLRIGHYIFIDLGWMSHPFPLNSFKIRSDDQIATIRSLGVERIRYSPQRSDPDGDEAEAATALLDEPEVAGAAARAPMPMAAPPQAAPPRDILGEQRASLEKCERLFGHASRTFRQVLDSAQRHPEAAREIAHSMVEGMTDNLNREEESCIRLLSEQVGERASLHAINITIVSLLLAKACGLDEEAMRDVGVGALLHDAGKSRLPERLRYSSHQLSEADLRCYREHVRHGVEIGQKMGLSKGALLVIGQHHEAADGSGYPLRLHNDRICPAARIVGLVDRYDNLSNPGNPAHALTPYEAMSHLFAQLKHCFDEKILGAFVRMMGVYPPGSVVQLSNDRYALVVSVNASRPLKPSVIIHDESVPREKAVVVDLSQEADLGIRRSLRPLQLPKATFDYLSPRQRACYFFEHGRSLGDDGGLAL